jgi:hypothetical protein
VKRIVAAALMLAATFELAACTATVRHNEVVNAVPLSIPAASSRNIVLNMAGSSVATESEDWEPFKGEWRSAMAAAAKAKGASFGSQDGPPHPASEAGTLVVVDVKDCRYLTSGARIGFGVMTGNAYVDANVRFMDLQSGTPWGGRMYNTSSTAWQGIFAAMTAKQIRALSDQIVAEINPR